MKIKGRISALALAAVISVTGFSVVSANARSTGTNTVSAATDDEKSPVRHDINADGEFDIRDATALQNYLADYDVRVNENELDVNYDNRINIKDATRIQKLLAKLIDDSDPDEIGKESEDIGEWLFL